MKRKWPPFTSLFMFWVILWRLVPFSIMSQLWMFNDVDSPKQKHVWMMVCKKQNVSYVMKQHLKWHHQSLPKKPWQTPTTNLDQTNDENIKQSKCSEFCNSLKFIPCWYQPVISNPECQMSPMLTLLRPSHHTFCYRNLLNKIIFLIFKDSKELTDLN